jgi:antitoxin component YwqK of YwqJK toxin-antitoxin module
MKQIIPSILTLFLLFSCSNSEEDKSDSTIEQKIHVKDTINQLKMRAKMPEPFKARDIESLYFTSGGVSKAVDNEFCDSLKSGIFGKYYLIDEDFPDEKGRLVGGTITVHVKEENIGWRADDTTQTIWKIHLSSDVISVWDSIQIGKKDGYFRIYYGDRSNQVVAHLQLYKKDSLIWSAFPAADSESTFPVKGFTAYSDSVLVQAPYVNGELWYKGLFVEYEPKGIHSIFDRNGKLLARTNYADSTVTLTKHADDEFIEISKSNSNGWSFIRD